MSHSDDSDELKSKRICFACVGEAILSEEIEQTGEAAECSYCAETAPCWIIEALADRIETAFGQHYTRTSSEPDSWQERMMADRESRYEWYREGEPIIDAIETAAAISSQAAADVQEILSDRHAEFGSDYSSEETEFSSDSYYAEISSSDQAWQEEWRDFEEALKTQARFFSRSGAAHLAAVFGSIDKLKTKDDLPIVVGAGPDLALDHLYRGRVFQSREKLEEALCRPDLDLGSPPARLASSGRMNARGISVFYGATDSGVAIAEVRPPVGSTVAVAKFSIIKPLRLLDLTALEYVSDGGSIFDTSLKQRMERVAFLRSLCQRMTRPVMPDDEAFDYLATQAVADFLATENEPRLDGIIFPSAQSKDGRNVVLFHKAARVEAIKFPKGTEVEASSGHHTDEGWEVDYSVIEWVPPPPDSPPPKDENDPFRFPFRADRLTPSNADYRESTLRVEPASVEVHEVSWVQVQCTAFKVSRKRLEKSETEF